VQLQGHDTLLQTGKRIQAGRNLGGRLFASTVLFDDSFTRNGPIIYRKVVSRSCQRLVNP
jgi:hypothetical protein